ncbi:TetR/AcrR family transcriptional regulator [Smaragdicoccus niigatensis]|uniref:TetR/AcrR family transcriptional regulator n=1 Tax=Smaragdicoccus niigatensis TaxID=359359 RepID=UPI00039D4578|nr:TetR/AcrR family transcriptional regulator [Smaragdicoccus niigatensis]
MLETARGEIVPDQHNGSLPRHRHNLTREQVESSQSARIINAAIELFGTEGYAATTVMDIVKRAGVSRKTFYEMFESKEAVVVAAYRAFDRFLRDAGVAASSAESSTDPADLRGIMRSLLTLLSYNPAAARLFFLEVLGAGDEVRRRRDAAIEQFTTTITPRLQQLRRELSPRLPELESGVVRILVGGGVEMIAHHLVHHTADTLPDLTDEISRVVLMIVAPTI